MNSTKIIYEFKDNVAFITLNNPAKMNCIGMQMLEQLDSCLDEAVADDEVKVVVLSGMGDRAFSTGADLKELAGLSSQEMDNWILKGNKIFNKLEVLPKPTVAFIKGYVMGGGLEMVLACDFRLGVPTTVISSPEVKNGWLPGWGGMTRLRRLFGEVIAKEIVLLGARIGAQEALQLRLINRLFTSENPQDEVKSFALELAGMKSSAFQLAKEAVMDSNRTTVGVDLTFDILALRDALTKNQ